MKGPMAWSSGNLFETGDLIENLKSRGFKSPIWSSSIWQIYTSREIEIIPPIIDITWATKVRPVKGKKKKENLGNSNSKKGSILSPKFQKRNSMKPQNICALSLIQLSFADWSSLNPDNTSYLRFKIRNIRDLDLLLGRDLRWISSSKRLTSLMHEWLSKTNT